MSRQQIMVTSALFYANGPIHLGHMLEAIQTDIFVRAQKLFGNDCYYICGSDSHGTPIMLKAEENKETPEAMIERISKEQLQDFKDFSIEFDAFYPTHSKTNEELVAAIYDKLKNNGDIEAREISQAYDEAKQMFLPDRYIKGTCPRCKAPNQYGDSCEKCGATYQPLDMIDPISVVSKTRPITKTSTHYFFKLSRYQTFLKQWSQSGSLKAEIAHKLDEWFEQGLSDWDISRDAPYFGFKIPGTDDKYFYVWLDAPIGYLGSFYQFCSKAHLNFDAFWNAASSSELHQFIGKDIMYFHALFWPAILKSADYRLPTKLHCHGFLTINGEKMSKSRGTFIKARDYLNALDPDYLRYYFAAKLNDSIEDIDVNFDDFFQRVNSDLIGKIVNIASRSASFINRHFDNELSSRLFDQALWQQFADKAPLIKAQYEQLDYARLVREIMQLADIANQFVDQHAPWALAKAGELEKTQLVCTEALNLYRVLMIYLKPIVPVLAAKSEAFLNEAAWSWQSLGQPLLGHRVNLFTPLLTRVEKEKLVRLQGHS